MHSKKPTVFQILSEAKSPLTTLEILRELVFRQPEGAPLLSVEDEAAKIERYLAAVQRIKGVQVSGSKTEPRYAIAPLELELRKLKVHHRLSEETNCFESELWVNRVVVAFVSNEGRGGGHSERPVSEDNATYQRLATDWVQKWLVKNPTPGVVAGVAAMREGFVLDPYAAFEFWVDEQIELAELKKDLKKFSKGDCIYFRSPEEMTGPSLSRIPWSPQPVMAPGIATGLPPRMRLATAEEAKAQLDAYTEKVRAKYPGSVFFHELPDDTAKMDFIAGRYVPTSAKLPAVSLPLLAASRVMISAEIGPMPRPMPEGMLDPMPSVTVTYNDGTQQKLFEFYPDEIRFSPDEFKGLTEEAARALRTKKDVAFLQSSTSSPSLPQPAPKRGPSGGKPGMKV